MNGQDSAKQANEGREKYWSEIESEEKISRMRQEVKRLKHEVEFLHELVNKLVAHRHSADGSIMVQFNDLFNSSRGIYIGQNNDEVYF